MLCNCPTHYERGLSFEERINQLSEGNQKERDYYLVGSSRKIIAGDETNSIAIDTLFFSPPLIPRTTSSLG